MDWLLEDCLFGWVIGFDAVLALSVDCGSVLRILFGSDLLLLIVLV